MRVSGERAIEGVVVSGQRGAAKSPGPDPLQQGVVNVVEEACYVKREHRTVTKTSNDFESVCCKVDVAGLKFSKRKDTVAQSTGLKFLLVLRADHVRVVAEYVGVNVRRVPNRPILPDLGYRAPGRVSSSLYSADRVTEQGVEGVRRNLRRVGGNRNSALLSYWNVKVQVAARTKPRRVTRINHEYSQTGEDAGLRPSIESSPA